MASEGGLARSQIGASDVLHDFTCTPCDKDGKNSEAEYQCIECKSYFCKKCIEFHNKILSAHTVLDKSAMKSGQTQKLGKKTLPTSSLPTIMCTDHPGETIKMFCGYHDVVCCTVCIAVKHRSCEGVEYIPTIATGIAKGPGRQKTKTSLENVRQELQLLMSKKKNNLTLLNNQHDDCIKDIRELKRCLVAQVEKLESESIEMVNSRHRQTAESIKTDISSIDDMLKMIDSHLDKVNQISNDNEPELFIQMKQSQIQTSQSKDVLEAFGSKEDKYIVYELNTEIESILNDIQTFVCIRQEDMSTVTAYTATFLDSFDITVKSDKSIHYVYCCCSLDDHQILITDSFNDKLKRLDSTFSVTDWIDISGFPFGVCNTSKSEVAVTLCNAKKVQFVSVGKTLSLTRAFNVGDRCRGICYNQGHLYVCCGGYGGEGPGQVKVYDKSGTELRALQNDMSGQKIFSKPFNISINVDSSRLYVADGNNGIITVDTTGNQPETVTDTGVIHATGITVDDRGNVFACGFSSNNVIQIDRHGNVLRTLLSQTDGIKGPLSLLYLKNPRRLAVCEQASARIKLYKLT